MADEGVMRELLIHPRIQKVTACAVLRERVCDVLLSGCKSGAEKGGWGVKVLHGDDEIEPLSFVPIN
eukprot:3192130-Rhodomonas_salina.3